MIKKFEQYNYVDPYGEEIWDEEPEENVVYVAIAKYVGYDEHSDIYLGVKRTINEILLAYTTWDEDHNLGGLEQRWNHDIRNYLRRNPPVIQGGKEVMRLFQVSIRKMRNYRNKNFEGYFVYVYKERL